MENLKILKVGDIVEGKVIGREKSALFLDLGPAGTGIIYGKEFQVSKDHLKNLKTGESIFVKVIDLENENGYVEVSIGQARNELAWENLKQKKEKGEKITVKISGANKGGLLTEILGVPAFLPVSQLSMQNYPKIEDGDTTKILKELQKFIGKEMEVIIFDISPKEKKLILSERIKDIKRIKEDLKKYKVGDVVEGEITGLTNFGAFIRFDKNLEGLIHLSELDWKIIEDPSEVVKVGEKLKVKIIEIFNDKVSLSLKALKEDPWLKIEKKFKKGDIVAGKITKLNPFGAFVEIAPSIQGLCHISEFDSQKKMSDQLKIGEKYKFQIILIDPKEHRMNLKLIKE